MHLRPCVNDPIWQTMLRLLLGVLLVVGAIVGTAAAFAFPYLVAWWMCQHGRCG